jgi:hypothetical protein
MAVRHAEKVQCQCLSTEFVSIIELTRHPGQGITTRTIGYKCNLCHEPMDLEKQSKLSELRRKQHELREVEMELSEIQGSQD